MAAVPSSSASAVADYPPVDHQLCYAAKGLFHAPTKVLLINQFSPNGFKPKITAYPALHCNPVIKYTVNGPFQITNPDAHLACLKMTAPKQATHKVLVTNQFGQATLATGQPNLLCVPSWKSLTGPPKKQPTTPPGLNHFTCYPVTPVEGSYQPGTIFVQDEFAADGAEPVTVNPVPNRLCLPTDKILLAKHKEFPIINPDLHLLCYPVTKTQFPKNVWDENQFGTSKMTIVGTKALCLPSTKQVIQ